MDSKTIRRENLLTLIAEAGDNVQALADKTGTDATYLRNIRNGVRDMGDEIARRLEEKSGRARGWMDQQHPSSYGIVTEASAEYKKSEQTVEIPVFDVVASMGLGAAMPEHDTVVDQLRLTRSWVNTNLPGMLSPHGLAVISAYGDSMAPTFASGDMLIVDRGVSELKLDAIYVLAFHDELYIKRIQRRRDGSIAIISDNQLYPPQIVPSEEKESVKVLGRVLWAWNGKKL